MGKEGAKLQQGRKAKGALSGALAASLAMGLIPAAAFAEGASEAEGAYAEEGIELLGAAPMATQGVEIGQLSYSLLADGTAVVRGLAGMTGTPKESQLPDDVIVPQTIAYDGATYTVIAIASNAYVGGKCTTTIPASVVKLGSSNALFGCSNSYNGKYGNYYFLGDVPKSESGAQISSWTGVFYDASPSVYCLATYQNAWATSLGWDIDFQGSFEAPTGVAVSSAQIALSAGDTAELAAANTPESSKYLPVHTTITWESSSESVAVAAGEGGKATLTVAADAEPGTVVVTARNALGAQDTCTVSIQAASGAVDMSQCAASPAAIAPMTLSSAAEPAVAFSCGAAKLVAGIDYEVSYRLAGSSDALTFDQVKSAGVGNYEMVVAGKGRYTGEIVLPFSIVESLTCGPWSYEVTPRGAVRIVGFDASASAGGNVVVPSSILGAAVAEIGPNALAGAAGTVVIPDTVSSIDATAFAGSLVSSVEFVGANASVAIAGQGAIVLPANATVRYFADMWTGGRLDSLKAVFAEGTTYAAIDAATQNAWTYGVIYVEGADGAPVSRGYIGSNVAGAGAYHDDSATSSTCVDVPETIGGVAIAELGTRALAKGSGAELSLFMASVPESVSLIAPGAFSNFKGSVRFAGACPAVDGASESVSIPTSAKLFFPASKAESWKASTWATASEAYDDAWSMAQDEANANLSWKVAGYAGSTEGDIVVPDSWCGYNVLRLGSGAIEAGQGTTKITLPTTYTVDARAITNIPADCAVQFAGKPAQGADYETEFTAAASGAKVTIAYPEEYSAQWLVSRWVSGGNYETKSYGSTYNLADFTFTQVAEGEYAITAYSGNTRYLQVPGVIGADGAAETIKLSDGSSASVSGARVVAIGAGVFSNASNGEFALRYALDGITIPNTVRAIGDRAFHDCQFLSFVRFEEGSQLESIGDFCFWQTASLYNVNLPASVKRIGEGAFACSSLMSIGVDSASDAFESADGVLYTKGKTELVCYPQSKPDAAYAMPETVKSIRPWAMGAGETNAGASAAQLKSVTLPQGLQSIGDHAFQNNQGITEIEVPNSVTSIGGSAFFSMKGLKKAALPENDVLTAVPYRAFAFCGALQDVVFPDTITSISEEAFFRCGLAQVNLGQGIASIGPSAFSLCDNLASVAFPDSVKTLGQHAFYDCDKLASIDLSKVETLGMGVFSGCGSLESIFIPAALTKMGGFDFSGCNKLSDVRFDLNTTLTEIGEASFHDDYRISRLVIPASVKKIGDKAFYNCKEGLENTGEVVFLSKGTWELGEEAFGYGQDDYGNGPETSALAVPSDDSGYDSGEGAGDGDEESYPAYYFDVYGYSYSSTRTNFAFTEDGTPGYTFFPLDVKIDSKLGIEGFTGSVANGTDVVLSVGASIGLDDAELHYEWLKDGERIGEGDKPTFGVTLAGDAVYEVRVTSSYDPVGYVTSSLSVKPTGKSILDAAVDAIPQQSYTGAPLAPLPVVKAGATTLRLGTDYTVAYRDNDKPGTGYIVITGAGEYGGTLEIPFAIVDGTGQGGSGGSGEGTVSPGEDQVAVDKAMAATFDGMVSAIGTVNAASGPAISAARVFYEGLSPVQKALTTKYPDLIAAEKAFSDLSNPGAGAKPADFFDVGALDGQTPHWVLAEGYLEQVLDRGLMEGYRGADGAQNGLFGPDDPITRGQVLTILYRYAHEDASATTDASKMERNAIPVLTDNTDKQYFTAAVNWAYREGILTGTPQGDGTAKARPNDSITREELAAILYRYALSIHADTTGANPYSFAASPDAANVSQWAQNAMGWCVSHGVMSGFGATKVLAPGDNATRAEMAKMIVVAAGIYEGGAA